MLQAILRRRQTPFFRSPLRSFLPRHQSTLAKLKALLQTYRANFQVRIYQFILDFSSLSAIYKLLVSRSTFIIYLGNMYSSDCIS